jgi:hypothetical protein
MQYIIFMDFGGKQTPILFPSRIEFIHMREQVPYAVALSCGQVHLREGKFFCEGGDAGLGVSARPEDAELIAAFFRPGRQV